MILVSDSYFLFNFLFFFCISYLDVLILAPGLC